MSLRSGGIEPAYERIGPAMFAVRGYDDVRAVLQDPRFSHWTGRGNTGRFGRAMDRWLNDIDARGSAVRASLARLLSPARTQARGPRIAECAESLLEAFAPARPLDAVSHLAAPLTRALLADVIGIPLREHARFDVLLEPLCAAIPSLMFAAGADERPYDAWLAFIDELSAEHAAGDDLIGDLLRANREGALAEAADAGAFTALFAYAGFENVTNFISNAIEALCRDDRLWRAVAADPAAAGPVVEELLRVRPPLAFVYLIAREAIAADGPAAGDTVIASIADANVDPHAFADPERPNAARQPNRHLSFGTGARTCIGAVLARAECVAVLTALTRRFGGATVAGSPKTRPGHPLFLGYSELIIVPRERA